MHMVLAMVACAMLSQPAKVGQAMQLRPPGMVREPSTMLDVLNGKPIGACSITCAPWGPNSVTAAYVLSSLRSVFWPRALKTDRPCTTIERSPPAYTAVSSLI
jgi:hypothetical protein